MRGRLAAHLPSNMPPIARPPSGWHPIAVPLSDRCLSARVLSNVDWCVKNKMALAAPVGDEYPPYHHNMVTSYGLPMRPLMSRP